MSATTSYDRSCAFLFAATNHGLEYAAARDSEGSFSLRGYVATMREIDVEKCWPFSLKLLQECIKEGKDPLLPPLVPFSVERPLSQNLKRSDLTGSEHEENSGGDCVENRHLQIQLEDLSKSETKADGEQCEQLAENVCIQKQCSDIENYDLMGCANRSSNLNKATSIDEQTGRLGRRELDKETGFKQQQHLAIQNIKRSVLMKGCRCGREIKNEESIPSIVKVNHSLTIELPSWGKGGEYTEFPVGKATTEMWFNPVNDSQRKESLDKVSQKEIQEKVTVLPGFCQQHGCEKPLVPKKLGRNKDVGELFDSQRVEGNSAETDDKKSDEQDMLKNLYGILPSELKLKTHSMFCKVHATDDLTILHSEHQEKEKNQLPLVTSENNAFVSGSRLERHDQMHSLTAAKDGGGLSEHADILEGGILEAHCTAKPSGADKCEPGTELMTSGDTTPQQTCPVCLIFQSSSNTALNAHIDHCLSSSDKMKMKPKWQRSKARKKRSIAELCLIAPPCVLDEFKDEYDEDLHDELKEIMTVHHISKLKGQRRTSVGLASKTRQSSHRMQHRRKIGEMQQNHEERVRSPRQGKLYAVELPYHSCSTDGSPSWPTLKEDRLHSTGKLLVTDALVLDSSSVDVNASASFSQNQVSCSSSLNTSTHILSRNTVAHDIDKEGPIQDAQLKASMQGEGSDSMQFTHDKVLHDIRSNSVTGLAGLTPSKLKLMNQAASTEKEAILKSMAIHQQPVNDSEQDIPQTSHYPWTCVQSLLDNVKEVNQTDGIVNSDNEHGCEHRPESQSLLQTKTQQNSKGRSQNDGTLGIGQSIECSSKQKAALHAEYYRDEGQSPSEFNTNRPGSKDFADGSLEKTEECQTMTCEEPFLDQVVNSSRNETSEPQKESSTEPPSTLEVLSVLEDDFNLLGRERTGFSTLDVNSPQCCLLSHVNHPPSSSSWHSRSLLISDCLSRGEVKDPSKQLGIKATLNLQKHKSLPMIDYNSHFMTRKSPLTEEIQNTINSVDSHYEADSTPIRSHSLTNSSIEMGFSLSSWKAPINRRPAQAQKRSLLETAKGSLRSLVPINNCNTYDIARLKQISKLGSSIPPRETSEDTQKLSYPGVAITVAGLPKKISGVVKALKYDHKVKISQLANKLLDSAQTDSYTFDESLLARHDRHPLQHSDPDLHLLAQKTIQIHPEAMPEFNEFGSTKLPLNGAQFAEQDSQMRFEFTTESGAQGLQPVGFHSSLPAWMQAAIKEHTSVSLAPLGKVGQSSDLLSSLEVVPTTTNRQLPSKQPVFSTLGKPVLRLMGKTMVLTPALDQAQREVGESQTTLLPSGRYLSFMQPAGDENDNHQGLVHSDCSQPFQVSRHTDNFLDRYTTSPPCHRRLSSASTSQPPPQFLGSDTCISREKGKAVSKRQRCLSPRTSPKDWFTLKNSRTLLHKSGSKAIASLTSRHSSVPFDSKYVSRQQEKLKGRFPSTISRICAECGGATPCTRRACSGHTLGVRHNYAGKDSPDRLLNGLNAKKLPSWISNTRNKESAGQIMRDIIIIDDEDDPIVSSESPSMNPNSLPPSCRSAVFPGGNASRHQNTLNSTFVTGPITNTRAFTPMCDYASASPSYFSSSARGAEVLELVDEQERIGLEGSRTLGLNPNKRRNHSQPVTNGKVSRTSETGLKRSSVNFSPCDLGHSCWPMSTKNSCMQTMRLSVKPLQHAPAVSRRRFNASQTSISNNASRISHRDPYDPIDKRIAPLSFCSRPSTALNSLKACRSHCRSNTCSETRAGGCSINMNPAEMNCSQDVSIPLTSSTWTMNPPCNRDSVHDSIHLSSFSSPAHQLRQSTITMQDTMYSSLSHLHPSHCSLLAAEEPDEELMPDDSEPMRVFFDSTKKQFSWFQGQASGDASNFIGDINLQSENLDNSILGSTIQFPIPESPCLSQYMHEARRCQADKNDEYTRASRIMDDDLHGSQASRGVQQLFDRW